MATEPGSAETNCTNRTVNELLLQEITVKAINQILTERGTFLKALQQNIADEIFRLREQKEQSEVDSHHREETMNRIKELQDFIAKQKTAITEFDEALSKSSSRRSPSLPTTSPWNSSPVLQSKSKHKKAPRH